LKYGGKLMQCLEEISSKSMYGERRMGRDGYMERYGMRKPYDDDEFVRYY
jgi:hypothetical protein